MKKLVYVSGTRADFGLMERTLLELNKHLDLTIIATGMYFSENWGNSIKEIEKFNFKLKKADVNLRGDTLGEMVKSLGIILQKVAQAIEEIQPDLIFIEGDRGEALAGAIVGAHLNIPVIHQGGGDISGSIDQKIRYAITMFSDYHLVGNNDSYKRLHNMGIPEKNIFNVGEPGLDDIIQMNFTSREDILKKFNINSKQPLLILIFHPNTKEFTSVNAHIEELLKAIKELEIQTIGIYANTDAGGKIINKTLDKYQKELPFLKLYNHILREDFLGLMHVCNAMVGNSSSGIIELPSFNKPFICVGTRQKGRLKAKNVIDVDYSKAEIIKSIEVGLNDEEFKKTLKNLENPYGDGNSYEKITEIILKIIKELD